jgi:GT2 family glycosyltransferase
LPAASPARRFERIAELTVTDLPRVSLCVLNWNGREYLSTCLDSLLKLDYPLDRLELILCDNGSVDGSVELVRDRYPRFKLIELDRNYGFAEGNNRAAEAAGGEWVGFLNNDMIVDASWLKDLVAPLQDNPAIACLASRIVNWSGSKIDFIGGGINFQGHGLQLDYARPSSPHDVARRILFACGGAMLVRRELFLEVGGFDPSYFAFFEDVDLGWRLNLLGHDVWYNPAATARHRHHGTASRFTDYQLKLLTERNALFTIFKNYDDDNFHRVVPVAMMLLNEKATLMAGVNVPAFRPSPAQPVVRLPHWERPRPQHEGPGAKLRRVIRQEGVAAVAAKAGNRVTVKSQALYGKLRPPRGSGFEPPLDTHVVPNVAISHMVAIGELAHNMAELQEKRAWIQGRRRRTDDEVLSLEGVLLEDPTFGPPDYLDFQHWLCEVTGINARFAEMKL